MTGRWVRRAHNEHAHQGRRRAARQSIFAGASHHLVRGPALRAAMSLGAPRLAVLGPCSGSSPLQDANSTTSHGLRLSDRRQRRRRAVTGAQPYLPNTALLQTCASLAALHVTHGTEPLLRKDRLSMIRHCARSRPPIR
jgi:hypothetical protein